MEAPVLYILAGPNGIGKTTSAFDIIPKNVPIINSDEIAKQVRTAELVKVNTQEYSNREAQKLVAEHLEKRAAFAIETNLSDEETWKFLLGVQKSGYRLHLVFLSTDDLQVLHDRIKERTLRGEHFVRPDIVEERYYTGLRLLKHYLPVPDVVQLIDNTAPLTLVALKKEDEWKIMSPNPPAWFLEYLASHFNPQNKETPLKDLTSIEEVKQRYRQGKKD
jgi:predicted ABC-type ATPase